jgi:1,4-alpha-glucan branching enzyme
MKTLKTIKNKIKKAVTNQELANAYGVCQCKDGVIFSALYPKACTVQVAGEFNNWQPEQTPMRKIGEDGTWEAMLPLTPGTYRYRLVVDGQWQQDPFNEKTEPNPFGELNSVLQVN